MCKFAVVQVENNGATESGKQGKVLALRHEYSKACEYAEEYVVKHNAVIEIFERVSTVRPTTSAVFEGRRRPGVA